MTALLAGLAFGAFGSGHCALMCGPLAALPAAGLSRVAYHAGRLTTYMALGLIAGTIGAGASMAGAGRVLAIASGLWLVGLAVGRWRDPAHAWPTSHALTQLLVRTSMSRRGGHRASSWLFGALNGLLPCGLVYAAAVGAAGFGSVADAFVFLAAFGVGTVPVLALTSLVGPAVARRLPMNARHAAASALAIVGVLLIMRGATAMHIHAETTSDSPVPAHHHH